MLSLQTSAYDIHPIAVPVEGELKTVNFYLILLDNQLILFDAGWNGDVYWNSLQQTLRENGFTTSDISSIILSHHHNDHCGLVNRLTEKHDIPVYAHERAIPRLKRDETFLRQRVQFFKTLYREFDCREKGDAQVVHLMQSIERNRHSAIRTAIKPIDEANLSALDIIHLPGHAPDQIGLWDKKHGILFGGDVLIEHISSNALVEPDENGNRTPSLQQTVESLHTIASLPVQRVYSGHGSTIEDPYALIDKRLQRVEEKGDKIMSLIEQGAKTGREIAQRYYDNIYDQQFSLVMSEIIGQLDYLESKGKVVKTKENGVWHYSSA